MIPTIHFKGKDYPAFQTNGQASRFCMPFALEVCKGHIGYDIGCNRSEWSLPNSILIDPVIDPEHDAMNLPKLQADYIFSSHCLEHLPNWSEALNHWHSRLKPNANLFLYLPNMDTQKYWRPWSNKKHIHYLTPAILGAYFEDNNLMWKDVFIGNTDPYDSFIVMAVKNEAEFKQPILNLPPLGS